MIKPDIRECLYLHIPEFHELQYRQNILQQPETMDYNKGFNIAIPGYDKNTGCILFAIDEWEKWYKVWVNNKPSRYYAYILRKYDNTFIGEVNLHKHQTEDWYEMGIVIEGKYRGMGYAKEALRQMLEVAFEAYDAKVVHNSFEVNRRTATYIHKALGFKEITQEGNMVDLWITKEDFHKNQRNNIYI